MSDSASRRFQNFLSRGVWEVDLAGIPTFRAIFYRVLRIAYLAARGFVRNRITMSAAALTYTTVLSLVPLLAIGFALAKGFGAYDKLVTEKLVPLIDEYFGEGGGSGVRDALMKMIEFVGNTNFANLGMIGLLLLFLTAIRLIGAIEIAFNGIWGVTRARTMVRKLTDYIAMLIIAPVALLAATAANSAAQSNSLVTYLSEDLHLGFFVNLAFKLIPLVVLWAGFTFMYASLPNTRVSVRSAIVGGIVGGTLWQVSQVLMVKLQLGISGYNKIYAGFAAIPIFLFWVFVGWVTVLLGAQVAWAHQQEPVFEEALVPVPTRSAEREAIALRALRLIIEVFVGGKKPDKIDYLATRLQLPVHTVEDVLQPLVDRGIIARADGRGTAGYIPTVDPEHIRVQSILDAIRGAPENGDLTKDPVDAVVARLRDAGAASPHNITLRELIRAREVS